MPQGLAGAAGSPRNVDELHWIPVRVAEAARVARPDPMQTEGVRVTRRHLDDEAVAFRDPGRLDDRLRQR